MPILPIEVVLIFFKKKQSNALPVLAECLMDDNDGVQLHALQCLEVARQCRFPFRYILVMSREAVIMAPEIENTIAAHPPWPAPSLPWTSLLKPTFFYVEF